MEKIDGGYKEGNNYFFRDFMYIGNYLYNSTRRRCLKTGEQVMGDYRKEIKECYDAVDI